jgi:hypothetical protein
VAYIGNPPTVGQWRKLDDISGSFNGSTTTFTTSVGGSNVTAGSANQLFVSLGGVIQQPNVDYSVTTNSIIFTTAPGSGLDFFAVLAGDALNAAVPGDGTITTAKLAGNLTVDLDSGSASAPSLTFDPNTGIYSPGEDEVAVSTNGTGRLFVDSTGRVGIGTSSPQSPLTVGATTDFGAIVKISRTDTNFNSGMLVLGNGNSTDNYVGVWRGDANSVTTGGQYLNLGGYDGIVFAAGASALGAQTERMRIDSSGRVGIGTTSPDVELHIHSTSDNAALEITRGAVGSEYGYALYGSAGATDAALRFFTVENGLGTGEKMRLDASGRLGIGTSSPDQALSVGSGAADTRMSINGTGQYQLKFTNSGAAGFWIGSPGANSLAFAQDDGTTRMTIDSSGRLGIGTTSPSSSLHVKGAADSYLILQAGTTDGNDGILFHNSAGVQKGVIFFDTDNDYMLFSTNNTERMRIDSSGKLLVGTSASRNVGSGGAGATVQFESTNYRLLSAVQNSNDAFGSQFCLGKSRGTATGSATIVQNNDEIGYFAFAAADGTDVEGACAAITAFIDGAPGNNNLPGRLVLSTTAAGSSTPTEQLRITSDRYVRLASGTGGIQFNGDTAAANALDDYEEGTWSPVPNGVTVVSGSPTYVGTYTRIGRTVHVSMKQTSGTITLTSGNHFTGLPFTPTNYHNTGSWSCANTGKSGVTNVFTNSAIYIYGFISNGTSLTDFITSCVYTV